MRKSDKDLVLGFYHTRLAQHGATFDALSSGTEERREIRFRVLTEVGISSGDSVLDLGCGFGDYAAHLKKAGIQVDYTGYDISPEFIAAARARYPGEKFVIHDILEEDFPEFDYIVSTSCFNLHLAEQENYDFVASILQRCYAHARKGVSIDFLTSYVDYPCPGGFHYEPERVFALAKRLTKRVCLRHDYPLFEFNVYLYRDFRGWGQGAA